MAVLYATGGDDGWMLCVMKTGRVRRKAVNIPRGDRGRDGRGKANFACLPWGHDRAVMSTHVAEKKWSANSTAFVDAVIASIFFATCVHNLSIRIRAVCL